MAITREKIIEIQDLWFEYPNQQIALKGIDLQIYPGEKAALVGLNGAGKSTLLLHLNGILNGRGTIWIDGIRLTAGTAGQVRALVGLVFQSPDDQLFSPTVFEDVAYGPIYQGRPLAEIEARVRAALSMVGMQDYSDRAPYHLSLGEKKRVAIATVLSMQPKILALDEPSAGLDPRARRNLISLLKELPHTMLIATHDLGLIEEAASRVLVMSEGKIVADGRTEHILEDQEALQKFLL